MLRRKAGCKPALPPPAAPGSVLVLLPSPDFNHTPGSKPYKIDLNCRTRVRFNGVNTMPMRFPILTGLLLAGFISPRVHADSLVGGQPPAKITPAAPPQAQPFSLHDVRLLDGPFKTGQDIGAHYLLGLEPDRLLANFRKDAGLTPKAKPYRS